MVCVGISATAGFHRMLTHNAYEGRMALHIFYYVFGAIGLTGSPIGWIRTHRTHHQYAEQDLDPHDTQRGFFFSHFGWMMLKLPAKVAEAEALQDETTLKYYEAVKVYHTWYNVIGVVLTIVIPSLFYGKKRFKANYKAVLYTTIIRNMIGLNSAAMVNSLAHKLGTRPNETRISAYNNGIVSWCSWGEGWHNYHHKFSKDYRASGHSNFLLYWNPSHAFILLCAKFGLAYNLKVACDAFDPEAEFCHNGQHYKILYKKRLKVCTPVKS